ncbi:MAG TPA: hypothetical protein VM713_05450, partial [Steroidobacteraceae bacterium]|nr:hypothetical protein [Steroidobacteraceae bacterium]
ALAFLRARALRFRTFMYFAERLKAVTDCHPNRIDAGICEASHAATTGSVIWVTRREVASKRSRKGAGVTKTQV